MVSAAPLQCHGGKRHHGVLWSINCANESPPPTMLEALINTVCRPLLNCLCACDMLGLHSCTDATLEETRFIKEHRGLWQRKNRTGVDFEGRQDFKSYSIKFLE